MPGRKYFGACLEQLPEELKLLGGREEGGMGNSHWRHFTEEFNYLGEPINFPHSFIGEQQF